MCPGVVSCADIVALAARDAIAMTRGPAYEVELGRKDGFVSSMDLAESMPDVQDSIEILKQKFMEKGLDEKDLVILTVGVIRTSWTSTNPGRRFFLLFKEGY